MMSRVPLVTIEVRPGDIQIVMNAARKAIDMGHVAVEGEQFDILAACGALEKALSKAQNEAA